MLRFMKKHKAVVNFCVYLWAIALICLVILLPGDSGYRNNWSIKKEDMGILLRNGDKSVRIPVLTYHCIDNNIFAVKDMFVSVENFEKQMRFLKDKGYNTITFEELGRIGCIKRKRPIMITFDDGYKNNYTNAYPILKKYNLRATIFVITGMLGRKNYLNADELHKMADVMDIESHTVHHKYLTRLTDDEVEYEVRNSQAYLEKLLNKNITAIAYPYGSYDEKVISVTKRYYKYGLATGYGRLHGMRESHYEIKRIGISNKTDIRSFKRLISYLT